MKTKDKKYFKKLIGNLRREIHDLFPQVMEAHMLRDHLATDGESRLSKLEQPDKSKCKRPYINLWKTERGTTTPFRFYLTPDPIPPTPTIPMEPVDLPDKPERKKCYLCEKPPITYVKFKDGKSIVSCVDHDVLRQFPPAQPPKPVCKHGVTIGSHGMSACAICVKESMPDKPKCKCEPFNKCDLCQLAENYMKAKSQIDAMAAKVVFEPDPTPPLHVRVVVALGGDHSPGSWACRINGKWQAVPRYDESVELAMGALEEYCRNNKTHYVMSGCSDGSGQIYIGNWAFERGVSCININDFIRQEWDSSGRKPLAISLAIVKHSEGK